MTNEILTIGYEGADIDSFISTLSLAGIEHLLDVRDLPISRKRGFSKSQLALALKAVGIDYTHLKALGDPKPGREAMKRGDYQSFLAIYSTHIATDDAQKALDEAANIARSAKAVLLCYERSPKECHRSIIVDHLQGRETFNVRHLGVQKSTSAPVKVSIIHSITAQSTAQA
ncbi:MAG: DUF488 family protein [Novosphingobium sp.]|uniref:DUF488 domain-containing protein n=1 Tax=Novosphingobium sp. TaxID=1874826 RepID=UPI003B9CF6E5